MTASVYVEPTAELFVGSDVMDIHDVEGFQDSEVLHEMHEGSI